MFPKDGDSDTELEDEDETERDLARNARQEQADHLILHDPVMQVRILSLRLSMPIPRHMIGHVQIIASVQHLLYNCEACYANLFILEIGYVAYTTYF